MPVEAVGDNLEFSVASVSDVTVYFNQTGTDSATEKYPTTNPTTARKFSIRANKTIELVGINGVDFTNPTTIIINTQHVEKREMSMINKIKLMTTTTDTDIKVRWF